MAINGASYSGTSTGYVYAGGAADIGDRGAQYSGDFESTTIPVEPRGTGYSPRLGTLYSPTETGQWGGTYGLSSASTESLIDTPGFALVLERGDGRRRAFSPEQPNQSIQSVSITTEVNTKSDWKVTVPPDTELYDWTFSRAVIGYRGERLFHGVLLPVESGYGESLTLGGFGPLWYATHGNLSVTYPDDHPDYESGQNIPAWKAIDHAWELVAGKTDSRVRGTAIEPNGANKRVIPGSGETFEGAPLEVIQRLHSYAGMAFAIDHSQPEGVATSFTPGEEQRGGSWQVKDYSVDIDPTDYANRVVVHGAEAPAGYPYDRYRGVAEALPEEINTVANGRIIEHNIDAYDLTSETACEEQAKSKLEELRGNYQITGSVDTTPAHLTPGYTYRVESFDGAAPDVFSPVLLPLQSVEHTFGLDDAHSSLKFETPEGVERAIRDQYTPDGVSYDAIRRGIGFGEDEDEEGGLGLALDRALDG